MARHHRHNRRLRIHPLHPLVLRALPLLRPNLLLRLLLLL